MKYLFSPLLIAASIALVLTSCSTPKNTMTDSPAPVSRGKFTGIWTITDIGYDGLVENAIQNVFGQAPPSAFRNSTWNITNSGNGQYTLADNVSQTFFWSVNNNDPKGQVFQFKKIYQGDKAKNITEGYQLYVVSNNGSQMVLKSAVALGNGSAYIIYRFSKRP